MTRIKTVILPLACLLLYSCRNTEDPEKGAHVRPMKEYSVGNSREYADKEKQLAPQARKSLYHGKAALLVEVPGAKADQATYIEKIGVMDIRGKEIAVTSIPRSVNPLTYAYFDWDLLPWSGKIKVFVKWNKYDLWIQEIDIRDIPVNK